VETNEETNTNISAETNEETDVGIETNEKTDVDVEAKADVKTYTNNPYPIEIANSVILEDVEEINLGSSPTKSNLEEIEVQVKDTDTSMQLKKPNEVYYEIYRCARERAKHMRKVAVEAFLEAKQIKSKYMLEDIDDSDDSDTMSIEDGQF
jgi:hypothetical protein